MPKGMNTTKANTPNNFANNKALASANGKKKNSKKAAATQAITKSPAITQGRTKRITPEVQDIIRDKLLGTEKNGHSYITNFIDNFMNEAKKDPNSQAARLLASAIFDPKLLDTLDETLNKQMNRDYGFALYQIRKTLYDKQQEVFDNDTDKIILAICSRRSGKTELMGRLLVKRLLKPDQHVVYINRSFDAAVRQIQKPFDTALQAVGDSLKIVQGSIGGGLVQFDNGSWLLIVGNNNAADVNKIRGEKVALVIIDEFGHMRHLKELVQEVLQPATIPFIPNKDQVIPQVCAMYGVTPDSMFIRREYFGDVNAYDDEAIYIKKYFKQEPPKDKLYHYAYVGIDWGYEDKAAVVGMVADKNDKKMYIVKDWSEAKKGITEISSKAQEMVKYLKENYKLDREPQVICDTNEKSAAQDLYTTYHIPNVTLAYKYDKNYALDQLSDWFAASTVVLSDNAKATLEDAENMIWKRDEDTDTILHELDEDAYHGNAMMAVLYCSRQFAYDVMGLIAENKPAKEITNAKEMIQQYETFEDNITPTGILELGDAETARHFVR